MNTTDVKAFFDRVASDWDTMRIAYYDERVIERLGEFADLTPEMVVADVGTGTGFVAAGIAPRTRIAHRVRAGLARLRERRRWFSIGSCGATDSVV